MPVPDFCQLAVFFVISMLPPAGFLCGRMTPQKQAPQRKCRCSCSWAGIRFPVKPFHEIFDSFPDMKCTFVEEKVGGEAFDNIDHWPYDAIVLYNFEKKPSEKQRENFLKLMDRGVGLVVLHHGLHAYRDWPEYQKIAGITSFVTDAKDNVNYTIHVEDPQHPIVKGLQDFAVKDETYHGNQADPKVHVILTTNEPTNYQSDCVGPHLSQVAGLLPAIGPRHEHLRTEGVPHGSRQRHPLVRRPAVKEWGKRSRVGKTPSF